MGGKNHQDPLEEIARLLDSYEEGLLKKKTKYQVVNGEVIGKTTEEIGEDENGQITISERQEFIVDDNGYPVDSRGTAVCEDGCIVGVRFLKFCPGCKQPLCRHRGILNGVSLCPTCFKLLRKELRKEEKRALKEKKRHAK